MPSPRYTVRLPPALEAQVQARVRAGVPVAVLIREALSAYLADTEPTALSTALPTGAPAAADTPADMLREMQVQLSALTVRVEILEQRQPIVSAAADSADTLRQHQEELVALHARVQILELALTAVPTPRRQEADTGADIPPTEELILADSSADTPPTGAGRDADTTPTSADTARIQPSGRQPSPERQRILELLAAHPEGLTAEQIRGHLAPVRALGDVLMGMRRRGAVRTAGRGRAMRHFLPQEAPGR